MKQYSFTLTGITPFLMHSNNIEARDAIEAERKKLKNSKAGDDRYPAHSWKAYLYFSDDGEVCVPTENLLACLLHAGAKIPLKKMETLKQHTQRLAFDAVDYAMAVGGEYITQEEIAAIDGEFKEHSTQARELGFRLLVKPCTVGTKSHVRVRPCFANWEISGVFGVAVEDQSLFPLSTLQDLWSTAGRLSGLGDWRPSAPKRPGQYGRFEAVIKAL